MLIVIGGLPATGKTTVARLVAGQLAAPFIRIDSIEQAIVRSGESPDLRVAGYMAGYAVAGDQLALGLSVVAECVNPFQLSRDAWRAVASAGGATLADIELVCSDPAEHRRRAESRRADIAGHVLPTWHDIVSRDYERWDRERVVIDTAMISPAVAAAAIVATVSES